MLYKQIYVWQFNKGIKCNNNPSFFHPTEPTDRRTIHSRPDAAPLRQPFRHPSAAAGSGSDHAAGWFVPAKTQPYEAAPDSRPSWAAELLRPVPTRPWSIVPFDPGTRDSESVDSGDWLGHRFGWHGGADGSRFQILRVKFSPPILRCGLTVLAEASRRWGPRWGFQPRMKYSVMNLNAKMANKLLTISCALRLS